MPGNGRRYWFNGLFLNFKLNRESMAKSNPRTVSRFDDFLKEEGIYDEVQARALKCVMSTPLLLAPAAMPMLMALRSATTANSNVGWFHPASSGLNTFKSSIQAKSPVLHVASVYPRSRQVAAMRASPSVSLRCWRNWMAIS